MNSRNRLLVSAPCRSVFEAPDLDVADDRDFLEVDPQVGDCWNCCVVALSCSGPRVHVEFVDEVVLRSEINDLVDCPVDTQTTTAEVHGVLVGCSAGIVERIPVLPVDGVDLVRPPTWILNALFLAGQFQTVIPLGRHAERIGSRGGLGSGRDLESRDLLLQGSQPLIQLVETGASSVSWSGILKQSQILCHSGLSNETTRNQRQCHERGRVS